MVEVWAAIPGADGYEASSLGRVRSTDRIVTSRIGVQRRFQGKVLQPVVDRGGYLKVSICDRGRRVNAYIHSLVLLTFRGDPGKLEARHINGDKHDNRLVNLEYGTATQNARDKRLHGTDARGVRNPAARLCPDDVRAIRASTDSTPLELAHRFGVSRSQIYAILHRRTWAHLS